MLAVGDHRLPLLLFSTLSPDEKSEFGFRHHFFHFISKRSSRREYFISPDLVRIQRFVDYRESWRSSMVLLLEILCLAGEKGFVRNMIHFLPSDQQFS
jgi:hypothetical protein